MLEKGISAGPNKSEAILFTKKKNLPSLKISLRGPIIPVVLEAKYLGITLDIRLSYRPYVRKVTGKNYAEYIRP